MAWIRDFLLKFTNFKMQINLISIIYKIFVYGLFVYLVVILDFGYVLVFDFCKCKCAQLYIFFPSKSAWPCTPRYRFYLFLVIGFNFIGLFNLSLLDFCMCYFLLHFVIVSVTLASLSYFNISKLCVFAFCFNFYLFFNF